MNGCDERGVSRFGLDELRGGNSACAQTGDEGLEAPRSFGVTGTGEVLLIY